MSSVTLHRISWRSRFPAMPLSIRSFRRPTTRAFRILVRRTGRKTRFRKWDLTSVPAGQEWARAPAAAIQLQGTLVRNVSDHGTEKYTGSNGGSDFQRGQSGLGAFPADPLHLLVGALGNGEELVRG